MTQTPSHIPRSGDPRIRIALCIFAGLAIVPPLLNLAGWTITPRSSRG